MVSLLCHLHFWTLKALSPGTAAGEVTARNSQRYSPTWPSQHSVGSDIGTHVYHEKAAARTGGLLNTARKEWAQGMWLEVSIYQQNFDLGIEIWAGPVAITHMIVSSPSLVNV